MLLTRIRVSVVAETPAPTPRRYLELLNLLLSEMASYSDVSVIFKNLILCYCLIKLFMRIKMVHSLALFS